LGLGIRVWCLEVEDLGNRDLVLGLMIGFEVEGWGFRVQVNVQRFRGGLVFMAHRLLYHSTLGLCVTKKKKKV